MDEKLDESDIDYVELLHESLIKDKLTYIGDIIYNVKDQTLEDLMGYTRDNLVEILRGINNDENNKHKIKTAHRYKFAKLVNAISIRKKAAAKRIISKSGKMQFLFITKQEEEAMKTIQFGQTFMKQNVLNMKTLLSNLNDNNQNIKHNLEQMCDLLKQQIDTKQNEMMKVINDIDNYYFTQLKQQNQTIQECAESVAKCYSNYQNCFNNDNMSKSDRKDTLIASKKGIDIEMDTLMKLIDLTYNIDVVFNKNIVDICFAQCLNLNNVHVDLLPVMKPPEIGTSTLKWTAPTIATETIKILQTNDNDIKQTNESSIEYQILYRKVKTIYIEDEKDEKEEKKDDNEDNNEEKKKQNEPEDILYEWNKINNLMNVTEYNMKEYIKPPYEAKINYTINYLLKSYNSQLIADYNIVPIPVVVSLQIKSGGISIKWKLQNNDDPKRNEVNKLKVEWSLKENWNINNINRKIFNVNNIDNNNNAIDIDLKNQIGIYFVRLQCMINNKCSKISNIKSISKNVKSFIASHKSVVHNFDVGQLMKNGWKCVYDKPYSHPTTIHILKSLCAVDIKTEIFVGGAHKNSKNKIILGAFGPSSVLHTITNQKTKAFIPADVVNKESYKVYWYNNTTSAIASFGFASSSEISCGNADTKDTNDVNRLSWHTQGGVGGYRVGSVTALNDSSDYFKLIYVKET